MHLTSFPAREGGNKINLVFPGTGIWSLLIGGGEFDRWSRFHVTSRADSTRGDKSWRSLHAFKAKDTPWRTGWKAKACTSFVLYLKVFKNHLYYLWHVRVLSIKPRLHTQLPEHNKSYRKVSRGWGHLITWNGPMMGHLNSFSASGGGNFAKIFQKFKCSGGCRGGCWSFDLTGA